MKNYRGGCHCGAVKFEVEAPQRAFVYSCNCSICSMSSYLHLIVEKENFNLKSGEEVLSCYTFNTGKAQHYFCSTCGVKSFYIPRSHPEGISVNARCLEKGAIEQMEIQAFDGRNWEENISQLSDQKSD